MATALRTSDPSMSLLPLPAGLAPGSPLAAAAAVAAAASALPSRAGAAKDLRRLEREARCDAYGVVGAALLAELAGGGALRHAPGSPPQASPDKPAALRHSSSGPARSSRPRAPTVSIALPRSATVHFDEWARRISSHGAHAPLLSPAAWSGGRELLSLPALRSSFPGVHWLDIGGLTGRPSATLDFALGRLKAVLDSPPAASQQQQLAPAAVTVSLDPLGLPAIVVKAQAAPAPGRPTPAGHAATGGSGPSNDAASLGTPAWVTDLESLSTALSSANVAASVPPAASALLPGLVSQWRVLVLRAADWLAGDRGVLSLASAAPHVTILLCFGSDDDARVAMRFLGRDAIRMQKGVTLQYKAAAATPTSTMAAGLSRAAADDASARSGSSVFPPPPILVASMAALERASPASALLRPVYDAVLSSRAGVRQSETVVHSGLGAAVQSSPYDALCAVLVALQERHGIVLGVINPPPYL